MYNELGVARVSLRRAGRGKAIKICYASICIMASFSKNSFCLVTGASRGLGREIAVQLSQEWSKAGKE